MQIQTTATIYHLPKATIRQAVKRKAAATKDPILLALDEIAEQLPARAELFRAEILHTAAMIREGRLPYRD